MVYTDKRWLLDINANNASKVAAAVVVADGAVSLASSASNASPVSVGLAAS